MKVHPIFLPTENSEIYSSEFNLQTLTSRKSYREYWRRALKKIKIALIFKRITSEPGSPFLNYSISYFDRSSETRSFVITPHNYFYLLWITFLSLCTLYLSTYGIFFYSFIGYSNKIREQFMEIGIDIVFNFDILISLNLGFFDESNRLVFNRKRIIKKYASGMLFLDIVVAVPLGIIVRRFPNVDFSIVYVFRHVPKLFKLYKIYKALKYFSVVKRIDYILILYKFEVFCIKLLFFLLQVLHIAACLFYLAASSENFNEDTWTSRRNINDLSLSSKYLTSLYWSLVTLISLGYGEITPLTDIELLIALIWMILGTFITSFTVSKFIVAYEKKNKINLLVDETLIFAENFANSVKIPPRLKNKLKQFIKEKKLKKYIRTDLRFLNSIDYEIKYLVATNLYGKAFTKIGFFEGKQKEFLASVAYWFEFVQFKENEMIWSKGCAPDGIYFLASGRVRYMHDGLLFYLHKDGEFFGDFEVFYKFERKFDVFSCSLSKILKIGKAGLQRWKNEFPGEFVKFKKLRKTRVFNLASSLAEMIVLRDIKTNNYEAITKADIEREQTIVFKKLFINKTRWDTNKKIKAGIKALKNIKDKIHHCKSLINDLVKPQKDLPSHTPLTP